MFKIIVAGLGAEITQGFLPIDVVESIYEDMDNNLSLEDYLLESLSDPDKLDWTNIDDSFHELGPYINYSSIVIEQLNQNAILNLNEYTVEDELHEDGQNDDLCLLTCIDESKGTFFESTVNEPFNLSLLKIKTKTIKSYSIITDIEYNNQLLVNQTTQSTLSKNFIAILEK